jgi:hypothetical protein
LQLAVKENSPQTGAQTILILDASALLKKTKENNTKDKR